MDRKRSFLNVSVSIAFRLVILVASIITRRFLIQYVGNAVNGVNSLYLSIVGFLSVAELGVGNAITFCMYRPIAEKDNVKVASLYQLFKKSYFIIGLLIFIAGVCLMPLLPTLAKGYEDIEINLYLTYFLMLISVVVSYMFSAKTSLINAYKDDYITTTISSAGTLFQYAIQILTLVLTGSFVAYLICRIVSILIQWVATEVVAVRMHKDITSFKKIKLETETKKQLFKNIKALFMHRIGGVLVNSADSLIISAFIGVVVLGKYSNYTTILLSMTSVIGLFFTPLTSVVGHMFVSEPNNIPEYYRFFHTFNFAIGVIFFLGYYAVIDNLITILFGAGLELAKSISFVVTVNYFVQFMRQSTLLFRDATGTFYNDRWKPLFEGLLNVVLSVSLALLFTVRGGYEVGFVGIIVATIITNLTICHVIEPYVLYKYAFHDSPRRQWVKNYAYIIVFVGAMIFETLVLQEIGNQFVEMIVNGIISIVISAIVLTAVLLFDENFRQYCKKIFLKKQ